MGACNGKNSNPVSVPIRDRDLSMEAWFVDQPGVPTRTAPTSDGATDTLTGGRSELDATSPAAIKARPIEALEAGTPPLPPPQTPPLPPLPSNVFPDSTRSAQASVPEQVPEEATELSDELLAENVTEAAEDVMEAPESADATVGYGMATAVASVGDAIESEEVALSVDESIETCAESDESVESGDAMEDQL